jgi:hypothetical protein
MKAMLSFGNISLYIKGKRLAISQPTVITDALCNFVNLGLTDFAIVIVVLKKDILRHLGRDIHFKNFDGIGNGIKPERIFN